jgi:hypothetical protein
VVYQDGTFAVHGNASSAGRFGEVSFERNVAFVTKKEEE